MRRTLTVAITASALIAGCAAAMALDRRARMPAPPPVYSPFVSASGASETLRDPEAYAVFDMVLSDVVGPIRSADVLTIDLQRQLRLPAGMPADWSSVVRDAREKNSRWWALDRSWSPGSSWRGEPMPPVRLIRRSATCLMRRVREFLPRGSRRPIR